MAIPRAYETTPSSPTKVTIGFHPSGDHPQGGNSQCPDQTKHFENGFMQFA